MADTNEPVAGDQSTAARIPNLVVQLMRTYTGRGPTKVWTSIDGDLITVMLNDTLPKGELSLVSDNKSDLVIEMRQAYQQTMQPELVAGTERLTGRTVKAFLSANNVDPDIAIETFVMEPLPNEEKAS